MNITLKTLKIVNFKGIKDLTIDFRPDINNIRGANGVGKTSIFDAFMWTLFGKDSHGAKDFDYKPLDGNNNIIPKLVTSVSVILEADGRNIKFTRTSKEKWTTKRGTTEEVFTGNETLYEVDDVPCKMTEYNNKVSELINESLFKILTSPTHFCNLKWQEQRRILMEIANVPSDEDIAATNNMTSIIALLTNGKSIEDRAKELANKKSKINKELEAIPIRIDEINRSLSDNTYRQIKDVDSDIKDTKTHIKLLEDEIKTLTSSAGKIAVEAKITKVEAEMEATKAKHNALITDAEAKLKAAETERNSSITAIEKEISYCKNTVKSAKDEIADSQKLLENLRKQYKTTYGSTFTDTACPCCGREWDADVMESKKTEFTANRLEKLKELNERGKNLNDGIAVNQEIIDKNNAKIAKLEAELAEVKKPISPDDYTVPEADYSEYLSKIEQLKNSITKPNTSRQEADISLLNEQLEKLELEKSNINAAKKLRERIGELEVEHTTKAQAIADIEKEENDLKAFRDVKISALNEAINNKFEIVKFKLYDTQINGGYSECCEATVNGVPYSSGLNDGSKINAGLDIINTLQGYYNTYAPVFIDNKESVVEPIKVNCQTIYLSVTNDKNLIINKED